MTQFTDRDEMFREFVADQMKRQTKSLDTIRTLMILWFVLTIVGAIFVIAAGISSSNSF
jgi:hypothetical protein